MQPVMKALTPIHFIYVFSCINNETKQNEFFYVKTDVNDKVPWNFNILKEITKAVTKELPEDLINKLLEFKFNEVVHDTYTYKLTKQVLSLN